MDTALVAALDRELHQFLLEESRRQGEGLYQWYRTRYLPAGIGISHYDKTIARFVLDNCGFADRFIEIGAGIGQQCMLIALAGRRSVAIESDRVNFDTLERATARIAERIDARLPEYMSPIRDWYPTRANEYVTDRSILCFPTLSWKLNAEKEAEMFDSLRASAGVIVGLGYFFQVRSSDDEQQWLINRICERGFSAPVDVCTWKQPVDGFPPNRIVYFGKARQ